ncbi:MAG: ATP-dependent DNA helicase RecQ [Bacteroidota bacterium]
MSESLSILKKYWGHDQFRPLQQSIVDAVIKKKDVLALLPTGGGKSVCFQVPAMMMDGLCIVVSPLIALMKDQVENLSKKGINALAIYSGMTFLEVKKTLQNAAFGDYKFLYISPERLETKLFSEFLPALSPCLIAIDEAHCISQWGYDFRPSYLKIAKLREELPGVPVIALTASATLEVQNDICDRMLFGKNQEKFQQSFARPNLSYAVIEPASKQTKLVEIFSKITGSGIVYCKSRKQTQQIAELLQQHKISADFYHAGLSNAERSQKQNNWINNKINTIVCTNAFGMGIDKPDVRVVVHHNIPESLENYYQEAGRAGRDGKSSQAILLFDKKEINELREINILRYPEPNVLKKLYADLMNYLSVPAGIGEGQSFDFDLPLFSETFKWNILQATYGLQALSQEGLFFIAENSFRPSQLVFSVSKEQLFDFEKNQPSLEPLIKGLLRSYEGIFDYPTFIHETLLAKFTSTPIGIIRKNLQLLHQYQIAKYTPATEKPQIVLLMNRMYKDDFKFNMKALQERKKNHLKRIQAMVDFSNNSTDCRSVIIANYFNDNTSVSCGNCDNCLKLKKTFLNETIFEEINIRIKQELSKKTMPYFELANILTEFEKEHLQEAIQFLQSEKIISGDKFGNLSLS